MGDKIKPELQLNCTVEPMVAVVTTALLWLIKPLLGAYKGGQGVNTQSGLAVHSEFGIHVAEVVELGNKINPTVQLKSTIVFVIPFWNAIFSLLIRRLLLTFNVGQCNGAQVGIVVHIKFD